MVVLSWARCHALEPVIVKTPLIRVESGINLAICILLGLVSLYETRNGVAARSWFLFLGLPVFVAVETFDC